MYRKISEKLKEWQNGRIRKPLIVRGARQVGKTYSLMEFGQSLFPRFHYLNFEKTPDLEAVFNNDLAPGHLIEVLELKLNTDINKETDLIIFDEIQKVPRALTSLKYFSEEMPQLAICAAGSLLGVEMSRESYPVGKVTYLDLYPLCFQEFLQAIGLAKLADLVGRHNLDHPLPEVAHHQLWDSWKRYLVIGGLPEAVKAYVQESESVYRSIQMVRQVQHDLLDTYMGDIAKHSGKVNAMHIEQLWQNVPKQLSRSQNGNAPKFRFRDALRNFRGYDRLAAPLGWLESARLVLRSSIVDHAEIPLAGFARENRFRQYFLDVGLLGAISNLDPRNILAFDFGTYKGYIAENFVAQEFTFANIPSLYSWEGRKSEVEFLLETGEGIIPIEVKSGRVTQSKSLGVYESRYSPVRSFVLSAKNGSHQGKRQCLPIYMAGRLASDLLK